MTGHQINSLVGDLVAMAQAMERLPNVEAELARANDQVEAYAKQVQRLEIKLIERSGEIDSLHSDIRQLEVARDDAELRFLEADDRTMRALEFIKSSFGAAGSLIQALEPPKPMPEVEGVNPLPVADSTMDHSASTVQDTELVEHTQVDQSEPNPIHATSMEDTSVKSVVIPIADVSSAECGRYAGKRYYDHPTYVNRQDWLSGGGSEADYDWRPSAIPA